jgi:hypothetical protein
MVIAAKSVNLLVRVREASASAEGGLCIISRDFAVRYGRGTPPIKADARSGGFLSWHTQTGGNLPFDTPLQKKRTKQRNKTSRR